MTGPAYRAALRSLTLGALALTVAAWSLALALVLPMPDRSPPARDRIELHSRRPGPPPTFAPIEEPAGSALTPDHAVPLRMYLIAPLIAGAAHVGPDPAPLEEHHP